MKILFVVVLAFISLVITLSTIEKSKKVNFRDVSQDGQIAEHKLSGKKCLVRTFGLRENKGFISSTDYSKIECVFEDGSSEWVYGSEYQVKIKEK